MPEGPSRLPPIAAAIRLGVLLSGGGRTLQNLLDEIGAGRLPAAVVSVLSSKHDAGSLERARAARIFAEVMAPKTFPSPEAYGRAIARHLEAAQADLAVMAGFTAYWVIPPAWLGHVLNVHPALLPAFGGKGFYGDRVHEAAWGRGVKVAGCTVHFADNEYDAGPIVLQRAIEISDADHPHEIAAKVFAEECRAYPEAIRLYREGRLAIQGRRVHVRRV